mmetsp:Transcript_18519/g.40979  ORF Transcript_18519/g.40979 Transcript_18519/m.40979 type:complete len:207 (-) Transcript_18519:2314-2934(-)
MRVFQFQQRRYQRRTELSGCNSVLELVLFGKVCVVLKDLEAEGVHGWHWDPDMHQKQPIAGLGYQCSPGYRDVLPSSEHGLLVQRRTQHGHRAPQHNLNIASVSGEGQGWMGDQSNGIGHLLLLDDDLILERVAQVDVHCSGMALRLLAATLEVAGVHTLWIVPQVALQHAIRPLLSDSYQLFVVKRESLEAVEKAKILPWSISPS